MSKIIPPGGMPTQISPDQALRAIMHQLEILQESINLASLKLQTLQNTCLAKNLVTIPELEAEWNKQVEELKAKMRTAIMTPDGKPAISTPEGKPAEEKCAGGCGDCGCQKEGHA